MSPRRCDPPGPASGDPPAARSAAPEAERLIDSSTLLQGARSVLIDHNSVTYRLYVTRAGKLILTK